MFKRIILLSLFIVSVGGAAFVGAEPAPVAIVPVDKVTSLAIGAPELAATSFLLVDYQSGTELVSYNAGMRVEPASITKLMTAYIIYRELAKGTIKLEDEVLISQKAWGMEGSRMFVEVGKRVQLEKLLRGLIIDSGNDAAVALAEHVAGSEEGFVARMNQVTAELNMRDTHYQNVTGWPAPNHYTTARDIVILARALISEFPDRYKYDSEKEFTYNKIKQYNRNKLLFRDPTVDGIKTGYTDAAGYCLVASAKRDDMRLISVMLGTQTEDARIDNSQKLLEYGFRTFESHKMYKANSVVHEVRIWKGEKETVPSGVLEDVYVNSQKGHFSTLKGVMQLDKYIDAPIKRGDVLGKIIYMDQDAIVKQIPLVALVDVAEGGLWRRMIDSVKKLFD